MSDCNTHIEIHETPGKTQAARFPEGLRSDFVLLDERKIEDLIVSTMKLSEHVRFFSADNVVDGNWSSFFSWESTSLLAEISTLNIQSLQREFKLKSRELLFLPTEEQKKNSILLLFRDIQEKLWAYHKKMVQLPDDVPIKEYYLSIYVRIEQVITDIVSRIEALDPSTDHTLRLINNHLFTKKIRNLFGLLTELKIKSNEKFVEHLNSYPNHTPQYALFLTFLKLFSEAQIEANKFTKRHLDYYYLKVLRLQAKEALPDYVHCLVHPHKRADAFEVEKDSILLAGKNKEGKARYYATTSDLAVNQAKIHQVFGSFKDTRESPDRYFFHDFTDKNAAGDAWKPFSSHKICENLGLAIASPLLFLKGGNRTIELSFFKDWQKADYSYVQKHFQFYLTGEEEWVDINAFVSLHGKLIISLPADVPGIVPFDNEIHDGVAVETAFPVLKMVAKDGKLFQKRIADYELSVHVSDYKEFSLFSDQGPIDHSKKFEAFGPIPKKDASIYFSSNEFFQKKNAVGSFQVTMDDTNWNLFDHAQLQILEDGSWKNQDDTTIRPTNKTTVGPTHKKTIKTTNRDTNNITIKTTNHAVIKANESSYGENPELNKTSTKGFGRIKFHDHYFGKGKGTNAYMNAYIQSVSSDPATDLPYLPVITEIKFSYDADSTDNPMEVFHLYPVGHHKNDRNRLLPAISHEGELFIGIEDVNAGQPLSLLIQVEEGTADPTLEPAIVKWHYLNHQNEWDDLGGENFGDQTNGLTRSGIVFLQVPDDFPFEGQSIFPNDYFWLRIAVPERTEATCNLVGLHLQAVKAVLTDYEETGVEFTEHIEPKTISKLLRPKNRVKKIEQPYASFGGRAKDTDDDFYQRTSERLRHRSRAISKWDYETLVLDEFPHVHRVKCLPHYKVKADIVNNTSAGNVTIVPVAKSTNEDLPVAWRPLVDLGTMKRIEEFLRKHSTPHATIDVIPPNLEHVRFSFQIKYVQSLNADTRLYQQDLNQLINSYLSPWAYKTSGNVEFQNEIQLSKIIHLVESQFYVDYVFNFKAKHFDDDAALEPEFSSKDTITPFTDYSLFLPGEHKILESKNECC